MLSGSGFGRGQDQPVVQVPEEADASGVGPSRHRGEDSGEDLQGGRQAEAEDSELVGDETEPFSGGSVDRYLEVGVLEVDGSKEVAPSHRKEDRGGGLHLEGSLLYELVERGEVDHGSPASGRLLHQEEVAVEAGTWIGYSLQAPLCHHGLDLLTQGESFWGSRGVCREQHRRTG